MTSDLTVVRFDTWGDVVRALEENHDVITCTMEALRNIDGYGKLTTRIRANLAHRLATLGIVTVRDALPTEAYNTVILVKRGSAASELLETIRVWMEGGGSLEETSISLRNLNQVPEPVSLKATIDVARDAVAAAEALMQGDLPTLLHHEAS